MMTKRKLGIHKKALIGIILFTVLLSGLMCASGSFIFDRAIQRMYNERGYVIANIILDEIDKEKIAEYSVSWEMDDYYYEMVDYLEYIQQISGAAYIYIGVPYEDHTIKYIYDSGSTMGFVDPIAAPFDEIWNAYTTGQKPESYLVRHSQYGYLTSSCLPIKDGNDKVVALLFVDTNMEVILSTINKFILNMSLIAVVLMAVFCFANWLFLRHNIINPLIIIRDNIRNFALNATTDEEALNNIKTNDELQELANTIGAMELDILSYIDNIQSITAEKERIGTELNVATRIQAAMLPRVFPPFPERHEFEVFATMNPAKEVGGDFYDFFFVDHNHLAIVVADVSGKGVPAALFMVVSKLLIKNRLSIGNSLSPAETLKAVNNQLCEGNEVEFFVTVWLGIIDITTGKGMVANAGHEHPALKRKGGEYELVVYKHSPAVGTISGINFREHEIELNPGDSLFLYTDGVTEATNENDELFGNDRLINALNLDADASPKQLLANVKTEIDDFVGQAPQFDDITMLGFTFYGKEGQLDD